VRNRRSESGEGRIGFVVTLALVAAGAFAAVRVVPVRVDAYNFRDTLREEARFAAIHRDDEEVQKRILEKAESLALPLDPKDLSIKRTQDEVIIRASYDQVVDLKLTTYTYRFRAEERAPLF
jgi:hypothetical protein